MKSSVVENATLSYTHRRAVLSVVMAVFALVAVALAMTLNGCGGGSSPLSATQPTQPVTTPTVVVGSVTSCSSDFYSNSSIPAVCYSASVAGCPNASSLNFTYSYDNPGSPKGTIVFLSGAGGTDDSGDASFAGDYFAAGYEVIQIEWASDWEVTNSPNSDGTVTTSYPGNVQMASCRGATLLNFIFNTNNSTLYSGGGRCAQGSSAGSGAIAYALTFYGAGSYLDAVELKSGPPLADFEQGCEEPPAPDVSICGQNNGNQFGCQLGGTLPWTLSPTYTGAASGVRTWTNDSSCAVPGTTTTAASNLAWLQQSIVNQGTNGVYNYPNTAMTAWLCQTIYQQNLCAGGNQYGQGGSPQDNCPNNAASQGEIYYAKLTSDPSNLPQASYNIYAVQNCDGPEGVSAGSASSANPTVAALNNESGTTAIENDMLTQCVKH